MEEIVVPQQVTCDDQDKGPQAEPSLSDASSQQIESVIEAILFASDEPIPVSRIASITGLTSKQVNSAVDALNQRYQAHGHAFRIERIAGGLQFLTLPEYNVYLRRLARVREDHKLTPAALETLAIIAYKQPIIRAQIEAIRGVACGEVIRSLMAKGLVKIVGRAEVIGRPLQYGTTKRFLEVFGLNSLEDLPSIEELKRPKEQGAP
ncbi:MAG: SMC-Scp complex subunit ScpB [Sedimentisphaerales bacterium]|nr:SMC-Scp complex subunit ScpB [Sedimentisphaerales bacterium]